MNETLILARGGVLLITGAFIFSLIISFLLPFTKDRLFLILSWIIKTLSISAALFILAILFLTDSFEVHLVWQYSSTYLSPLFKLSALWSSQEGSFLLWTFWTATIGLILVLYMSKRGIELSIIKSFSTLAFVQTTLLLSFLIGIRVVNIRIGSNPFALIHEVFRHDPFLFLNPEYVPPEGSGLNPLLRSYWMLVHPPVLFMGYAAMSFPSFFATSLLITGNFSKKTAQMWKAMLLLGLTILGGGIILGSLWAYEALSFGGYWAWDPVENASLMPWLAGVAALHMLILWQRNKKSFLFAYIIQVIALLLVYYAAFLTRSGILEDTSVHSFTNLGFGTQIIVAIAIIAVLSVIPLLNIKRIATSYPMSKAGTQERISSREFWMTTGVIILLLSLTQIFLDTSRPVWNALFSANLPQITNPESYYTRMQLPLAIAILLLAGNTLLLRYNNTTVRSVIRLIGGSLLISAFLTICVALLLKFARPEIWLVLFASFSAVISSVVAWLVVVRKNPSRLGEIFSHAGLGILIIGVVISITLKTVYKDPASPMGENLALFKNEPRQIQDVTITYLDKQQSKPDELIYIVKVDDHTARLRVILQNENIVSHPYIIRKPFYDLFMHVNSIPVGVVDTIIRHKTVLPGDTIMTDYGTLILTEIIPVKKGDTTGIKLSLLLQAYNRNIYRSEAMYLAVGNKLHNVPAFFMDGKLMTWVSTLHPQTGEITMAVLWVPRTDWIVVRIIKFPGINLVWLGFAVITLGFAWSTYVSFRTIPAK